MPYKEFDLTKKIGIIKAHHKELKLHTKLQQPTWHSLFIFIQGALLGAVAPNIINDHFFFSRSAIPIPLSSFEQIWYNYYSPAIVYILLFGIAFMIYKIIGSEKLFIVIFTILFILTFFIAIWKLGITILNIILTFIPSILLLITFYFNIKIESHAKIQITKRSMEWDYIFAFVLGNILGSLTPSAISDYLFFSRSAIPIPLSSLEQIFYFFYAPAITWLFFIILAAIIHRFTNLKGKYFALFMVLFTIFALIMSLFNLGFTTLNIMMLIVILIAYCLILWTNIYAEVHLH